MSDPIVHMQPELADASIVYLDDQLPNLKAAQRMFLRQGIAIEVTESIDEAKGKVLQDKTDLFLCDLRLDDINEGERGDRVLRFIRNKKKGVFLGLYTAYLGDLSTEERRRLQQHQIYLYDKSDHEVFLMNLEKDYRQFRQMNVPREVSDTDEFSAEIFVVIKELVLKHLNNISNKDVTVPIPGERDVTVHELIQEVGAITETGKKYIKGWIDTMVTIQTIKKNFKV